MGPHSNVYCNPSCSKIGCSAFCTTSSLVLQSLLQCSYQITLNAPKHAPLFTFTSSSSFNLFSHLPTFPQHSLVLFLPSSTFRSTQTSTAARMKIHGGPPDAHGGCSKFFCAKVALGPPLGEPCAYLARPQSRLNLWLRMFSRPVFVLVFV